ncbi:MAG: hypothetical protein C4555_03845 [Dehalococcoidia bacterium]|nr:MAG: hypothetical protein C4555_03845 [Dehalococcoidia bacterium]
MKELVEVIRALTDLIEKVQKMAGGKVRGQLVFWVFFVLLVFWAIRPAYEGASFILSKIWFASPLLSAFAGLVIAVTGFLVLFGVITLVASFPGQFIRSALETGFRIRLNDTFIGLLSVLENATKENPNSVEIKQLFDDTQVLYAKYRKSKTNILVQWVAPSYFRKDPTKWKLVDKDAKLERRKK